MGKIRLKETPEERAERKRRKARKAERKAQKYRSNAETFASSKYDEGLLDFDEEVSAASSSKVDLDKIRIEIEERRFREKLFDAMEDDYDARLDTLETRMNDYVHIPERWKNVTSHDAADRVSDPNLMSDEEYAEWIREGMWRRTHKAEMEERDRRKAEYEARKAAKRKAREETKRLEKEREAERILRCEAKERRRRGEAWEYYESAWKRCISTVKPQEPLRFQDIPWPTFSVPSSTEDLSEEQLSAFLFPGQVGNEPKVRKERIREALLRWHPDKFEGKMGSKLDMKDKDIILEGVGMVARYLNNMMVSIKS